MIRCLLTHFDILRLSLAHRPKPLAAIIQNDDLNCILSAQSTGCPRSKWRKMTVASSSNTVDRAPAAKLGSPASILSPKAATSPRGFLLPRFVNAGHPQLLKAKLHLGPHRKTLRIPDIRRRRSMISRFCGKRTWGCSGGGDMGAVTQILKGLLKVSCQDRYHLNLVDMFRTTRNSKKLRMVGALTMDWFSITMGKILQSIELVSPTAKHLIIKRRSR